MNKNMEISAGCCEPSTCGTPVPKHDEKNLRPSLGCLLIAQTQVVFNDNAAKLMLVGLCQLILPERQAYIAISVMAALLVLPFILFSPVAGWIADRYSKRRVLNLALLFQFAVMIWIVCSLFSHSLTGAIVGFFLLAFQASIFSPAKQGILKELVGSERLGVAVGWMEMLTILAILTGSFGGAWAFDHWTTTHLNNPWMGSVWTAGALTLAAIAAWIVFQGVRSTKPQSAETFSFRILGNHFAYVGELWREKHLRLAALGIAYFYSFGGVLYLTLVQIGHELHQGQVGSATETGMLLFILGMGVAVGCLIAAAFCRRGIEIGLVPIGGVGITLALAVIGFSTIKSATFNAGLVSLGVFSGLFTVPLNAFLQDQAHEDRRGRVIAATNLLTNIGGVLAVGIQYLLGQIMGLTGPQQFLLLILPSLAVALYIVWLLPESLLRISLGVVTRGIYRVTTLGVKNLPKQGGVLLICNHVSYVDALILQIACPRKIHFVAYEDFHKRWWLGWALRILQVIPISSRRAKNAIRSIGQKLKDGEVVCVFPEGELTRTGTLLGLRKGFELMARYGEAPVVPVYLDSLWGSIFTYSDQRYFWKIPRQWPYKVLVNFGKPMPAVEADVHAARQALLDLGEESFQRRSELRQHLGYVCLKSMTRMPWKLMIIDRSLKRKALSRGKLLALAIALSRRWKKTIPEPRVGIVLPPGIGGAAANLGLVLAGKIPVNLNFTAGRNSLESSLRDAGVKTVLSSDLLLKKLADFPSSAKISDIGREIGSCKKISILFWLVAVWTLPAVFLAKLLKIPKTGDRHEAALLFTSGSSGDPKGVPLSHRNILGNVAQFAAINIISRKDKILGSLPLFHSFGFTVTLWYSLLRGVRLVTVPSPLDAQKIGNAVREEKATILLSTPTFLRTYLRKLEDDEFQNLRLVITGAEKLPPEVRESFSKKFHATLVEGYGITETSPAISANIPYTKADNDYLIQRGVRKDSVGRLIPGMTARLIDPETQAVKSPLETGILCLKGPNVFDGYLNDEKKTAQAFHEGWFVTGDLARFDEDGFLFLEGRLSRFSKIGGEMVPHGTVEQKIIETLGLDTTDHQPLVVIGIPDDSKGEAIAMISTVDISMHQLREKLISAGLPNLWIPKIIKRVDKIPALASGKTDLKECQNLAKQQ